MNMKLSETEEELMKHNAKLYEENRQLKKRCIHLQNKNKELARVIHKIKKRQNKQHFKNGKRGSKLNG